MESAALSNVDESTLRFMMQEAEKKLAAQQSLATAADGRAGGLLAAGVGLASGAIALAVSVMDKSSLDHVHEAALAAAAVAMLAAFFALAAARPVDFHIVGWRPSTLLQDVEAGTAKEDAMRSIVAFLNKRIVTNDATLDGNAGLALLAMIFLALVPFTALLVAVL